MNQKLNYHSEEQLMQKHNLYDQLEFELLLQLLDSICLFY